MLARVKMVWIPTSDTHAKYDSYALDMDSIDYALM